MDIDSSSFLCFLFLFKGAECWRRSGEDEAGLRRDDCLWFVYGFLFCGSSVPAKIIHRSLQHSCTLPHGLPSHGPRTLRSGPQGTSEWDRLLQSFEDRIPSETKQEVLQGYNHNWIRILNGNIFHCTQNHPLIHNPCRSLVHQTLHKCACVELSLQSRCTCETKFEPDGSLAHILFRRQCLNFCPSWSGLF